MQYNQKYIFPFGIFYHVILDPLPRIKKTSYTKYVCIIIYHCGNCACSKNIQYPSHWISTRIHLCVRCALYKKNFNIQFIDPFFIVVFETGCIGWELVVADFANKTGFKPFGVEYKYKQISGIPLPIISRDLIR